MLEIYIIIFLLYFSSFWQIFQTKQIQHLKLFIIKPMFEVFDPNNFVLIY